MALPRAVLLVSLLATMAPAVPVAACQDGAVVYTRDIASVSIGGTTVEIAAWQPTDVCTDRVGQGTRNGAIVVRVGGRAECSRFTAPVFDPLEASLHDDPAVGCGADLVWRLVAGAPAPTTGGMGTTTLVGLIFTAEVSGSFWYDGTTVAVQPGTPGTITRSGSVTRA